MAQYSVAYDSDDFWELMERLPNNTVATAYEIELSDVPQNVFSLELYGPETIGEYFESVAAMYPSKYISLTWDIGTRTVIRNLTQAKSCFKNAKNLASVDLSDFVNITNATSMLEGCSSLQSVDFSPFSSLTLALTMCKNCTGLTSVNISGLQNVTEASSMFNGCTGLTSVSITGMSNCLYTFEMFNQCLSLVSCNVSSMTSVVNAGEMFFHCKALVNVNVSGMVSISNAENMFSDCNSLASIDVSRLIRVTAARGMFEHTAIGSVDISAMTSLVDAKGMFRKCEALASVNVTGLSSVTETSGMFDGCVSLTSVDLTGMDAVVDAGPFIVGSQKMYGGMFEGCTSLTEIHGWEILPTIDLEDCFKNCIALEHVYTVEEFTPSQESTWHAWDIKKDTANSRSEVTIYGTSGNPVTVQVPSSGSYTLEASDKVDELLFSGTSAITQTHIDKMLATQIPITGNANALDPTQDNFVMLAKDRNAIKTNITTDVIEAGNKLPPTSEAVRAAIGSVVPVDIVEHGNMSAVTSNAVSISLSYSTEETLTGGTWIDGKPIYKRTFEVYKEGVLNGWTRNGVYFTCSAGLSYIDQLIKNEAITDRCILTSYGFGTDNVQYPVGIYRNATNTFEIRNGNANNFFGTKCILTIEYTRKTE